MPITPNEISAAPFMTRLRDATQDAHAALEQQPFLASLAAGQPGLAAYVAWLQALAVIHEALAGVLASSRHPMLKPFRGTGRDRLARLDADISNFHGHKLEPVEAVILRAHVLAQSIRLRGRDSPAGFLGCLYVLEGSALGGLVLREALARGLGLEGDNGLSYLAGDGRETRRHWLAFGRKMEAGLVAPEDQEAAIAAARSTFQALRHVLEALDPATDTLRVHPVQELNPEAGAHAITVDSRELQAALLAGERSWARFPYYAMRYGERGLAYTRSDSAWLVQLTEYDEVFVEQQVRWLGRVLAARGMPRLLLERHLLELHAELVTARPDQAARYEPLQKAALMLAEARRAHLGDGRLARLQKQFDRLAGPEWTSRLPHTGALLAAAVADEADGIYGAVASLQRWLTDPARFPERWIYAVQEILDVARRRMGPAPAEALPSPAP